MAESLRAAAPEDATSGSGGPVTPCPDNGGLVHGGAAWPLLPTETDIYILPDGRVVFSDLPAELTTLAAALGVVEPCEIAPDAQPDSSV